MARKKRTRKETSVQELVKADLLIMPETVPPLAKENNKSIITPVIDTDMVKELLEEMKRLRAENEETKLAIIKANAAVETALQTASEQFEPKPMADWIDPHTDRPANLEEKLDCMATQAKENGSYFDRERTRKILLGLPVDDSNIYTYMGKAFPTEEALNAYKGKVEEERERTVGRFPRN